MSLGILGRPSLGDASAKYPWHTFSQDTLELQLATNQALQAAGFCHIPASGILDGITCGARNHLTVHSREYFGNDMLFATPPACSDPAHADELQMPWKGCFEPTDLKPGQKIGTKLTSEDWILVGGAFSLLLAGYLALTNTGAKQRPQHA